MNEREEGGGAKRVHRVYMYTYTCLCVLSHDERQKERSSESVIVHTQVFDKR